MLIDCGKTFYSKVLHYTLESSLIVIMTFFFIFSVASAIEILPKYGIRELDGVIITHGHADACYGMDDLRGWTLGGIIQPHINVHLSYEAMEVIGRTFPFLVDSSMATGTIRISVLTNKG